MAVVVLFRWPADVALAILGLISFSTAVIGRLARRRTHPGWECIHIPSMGLSYIALVTAFYVDNGPHLPFWDRLPLLALWIIPSAIGLPVLAIAWFKRCPPSMRIERRQLLDRTA